MHTCPAEQLAPALPPASPPQPLVAPQYWLLVVGSTHPPPQSTRPEAHVVPHTPALHTVPPPHTAPLLPPLAPHPEVAPQCAGLLFGSMHVPAQLTCPVGHATTHFPAAHVDPDAHSVPHAPQFRGSVETFTHSVPQVVQASLVGVPPSFGVGGTTGVLPMHAAAAIDPRSVAIAADKPVFKVRFIVTMLSASAARTQGPPSGGERAHGLDIPPASASYSASTTPFDTPVSP